MWLPKLVAAGLMVGLSGCSSDQQQQLGECKLEFSNRFPGEQNPFSIQRLNYLTNCMQAAGYQFDLDSCNASSYNLYEDAWCYAPMGYVSNLSSR
jgi:hypothetical protein